MRSLSEGDCHPYLGLDVARLVELQARALGDKTFLVWAPFEAPHRSWSFAAFAEAVARVAAGLARRGVGPGAAVLIHTDNCPEHLFAWYACAKLGAVAVTTNTRSAGPELAYFASDAAVVGAITQPKYASLVAEHCRGLQWLFVTETDCGAPPAPGTEPGRASRFEALDGDPAALPAREADARLPVGVMYTSGTTARPKGVVWTHANALWGAQVSARHESLMPEDIHLVHLPLFHCNAQSYSVAAALWTGAAVALMPRFSASRFWETALRYRCTWTSIVPFCQRVLAEQPVPPRHHFRLWGSGVSSPPSDALFGVKTIGWWGMTETVTHGIVASPFHPNRPLGIGRPAAEYEIAILSDDGGPVEPGETGNLLIRGIRGVSLFAEYLNNPQATEDGFDDNGFFKTGDLVTLHEDGVIQFSGRAKDMLKVGGENVAAAEIELVLLGVPGVREAAVVGKPDALRSEVPIAFVALSESHEGAADGIAERILEACRRGLADFKVPREIRILDALPHSTLEKVDKVALRRSLVPSDSGTAREPAHD